METIRRGNAAEAAVLAAFVAAGFDVFVPFGGGSSFDLLAVGPDGEIVRIQVKSGRLRGECLVFNTCGTDHGRGRRDYSGRADVIATHIPDHGVFVLDVDECPAFCATLRLTPARNGQKANVRMADEHAIDRWLARRAAENPPPAVRGCGSASRSA